ncbi:MAG: hypothetical protein JW966_02770 [Anaerolineae bacterium]|nr:hypothetical protein [Anaerolineae bacterium]
MMKDILINNPIVRRLKRSQRGQSILLMAFAFIALIAFVGLVTDVALLFVRYAALRRAVDAAAIAAAGQIREGTDYGEVTVAAQQYIELHGIESDSVLVETCETDIHKWRIGAPPFELGSGPDGGPHSEEDYSPVSKYMPETELCDWDDPRKLVRVSAQIESPTTFLSLIGIDSITLETASVSETAVLDVALVIDISESMSQETVQTDLTDVGLMPSGSGGGDLAIRGECEEDPAGNPNYKWAGCCNDPGTGNVGDGSMQNNGVVVPNGVIWHDENSNGMYDGDSEKGLQNNQRQSTSYSTTSGFNFSTLICMPFKDVKDAARAFIKRLDFVRGDRVVFVTFAREGVAYTPTDSEGEDLRPLIRSEKIAITTLDTKVGVLINDTGDWNICERASVAPAEWTKWLNHELTEQPPRPLAYETLAACGNTNVGGGILAANNALTAPEDIRREAVWVMIVLSDGAANVTDRVGDLPDGDDITYGSWGYCPWQTFCVLEESHEYHWDECVKNNPMPEGENEPQQPWCNDNDPRTRHFCLDWESGEPEAENIECSNAGDYDADDYARDMADFAGLINVAEGKPGNFIAMFSIAFGKDIVDEPTAAPLLRYIADAGDNGFIDNNFQQDLREDRDPIPDYGYEGPWPDEYGDPGPCEDTAEETYGPKEQCGQYYYAADLSELKIVFEEIASRLFTRLSR